MEATGKAIKKARSKSRIRANIDLCIRENVCPVCAEELKETRDYGRNTLVPGPIIIDYECASNECEFTYNEIET